MEKTKYPAQRRMAQKSIVKRTRLQIDQPLSSTASDAGVKVNYFAYNYSHSDLFDYTFWKFVVAKSTLIFPFVLLQVLKYMWRMLSIPNRT